ncbi:MAG: choice-of-anchor D domain-containing protein, partial [Candidatus Sulfotelmatobacter sp.]
GSALPAGQACDVGVTFTPTVLGEQSGRLRFTDTSVGSPQMVTLLGVGAEPATLSPASHNYGKQAVGTTGAAKTFTMSNKQNVTLTSIAISTNGDFAITATTCATSLGAGETCTISVTFTPTQTGIRTGQLTVSDRASNSPQVSTLTGTGTSD